LEQHHFDLIALQYLPHSNARARSGVSKHFCLNAPWTVSQRLEGRK